MQNTTSYTVYTAQLVEHLKIERTTPTYWQKGKLLTPVAREIGNHYSSTDVDAFLAREAWGFETPPTFRDIVSGRLKIATPNEAAALLGLSTEGILEVMRRGRIRGFRLGHTHRYDLASIHSYAAQRNNEERIPMLTVEHILTLSRPTVRRLVNEGKLADASDSYRRRVSRESLLVLLREMLPDWIDPRDWLEDRFESRRPLIAPIRAAHSRADKPRIEKLLDRRKIQFIHNPYGNVAVPRLISPDSWFAYIIRTEPPLTPKDLAAVFGVTRQTIDNWRAQHSDYFACSQHDHTDATLYFTCLLHILSPHLTKGQSRSAKAWYESIAMEGRRIITPAQAATMLGQTAAEVIHLLESNKLFGLKTPTGNWLIARASVGGLRDHKTQKRRAARS